MRNSNEFFKVFIKIFKDVLTKLFYLHMNALLTRVFAKLPTENLRKSIPWRYLQNVHFLKQILIQE